MNTKYLFILLFIGIFVLTGCSKSISEITSSDDFIDKTVSVKGTVKGVTKIGNLSGYILIDSNEDEIIVASEGLPANGDKITAKGTLLKGPLGFGFYIDSNN